METKIKIKAWQIIESLGKFNLAATIRIGIYKFRLSRHTDTSELTKITQVLKTKQKITIFYYNSNNGNTVPFIILYSRL